MPARTTWRQVQQGKVQRWQKLASDAVDWWAKVGARKHTMSARKQELLRGCEEIASAAAQWAGRQEAHLADNDVEDDIDDQMMMRRSRVSRD